ncbi:serine threonine kinase [Fusarium longipes]|uniref:Serine threonine kinase n=1 Tax=Fusarium longipes TaxID=694270 RepID=A0A395T7N1_9HYPO|nr:serine threonine kinase [Fusarium longipes]
MISTLMTSIWNYLNPRPDVDKAQLSGWKTTIRRSLKESVISKSHFLPESEINKLVTKEKIKQLLPNAKPDLVDFICKDGKKLFMTASWHLDSLQVIMSTFKDHGMTDKRLPICNIASEDRNSIPDTYSPSYPRAIPRRMAISAPSLKPKSILAISLVTEHQGQSSKSQTCVALKELKNLSEPNYNVEVSWRNEADAVFQIAELRHKHLISQATAFKHEERRFIMLEWADGGTLRDILKRESHEKSVLDGNKVMRVLEELTGLASALSKLHGTNTGTKTGKATSTDHRKKYGAARSKTILSGGRDNLDGNRLTVPKIRFEGVSSDDDNDSSDNTEEQHWRHGDLKPENILHFKDEASPWLGTLKIADLGLAKQHAFATSQRQDPTQQKYSTSHYEAPEVITNLNTRAPRSRRYDVWSMGCIIFECVIWLLYGNKEGLGQFYKGKNDIDAHRETLYFTADLTARQAQVSGVVRRWMTHILEVDPECNRSTPSVIKDLIILVRDKLLVVDLPKDGMSQDDIKRCRASADDLEKLLKKIMRAAMDDEQKGGRYLSSGINRTGVSLPQQTRRPSCLSTSSSSTSKQSNLVRNLV